MEVLNVLHAFIDFGILTAVAIGTRKLAKLEFMVELMWEEYHARNLVVEKED